MKKGKKFVSIFMLLVMVLLAVGCGKSTVTETSETALEKQETTTSTTETKSEVTTEVNKYDVDNMKFDNVTIKVASRYGADSPDETYFRTKIQEFNDLNKGITVELDSIPTESDYLDNLRTNFASGDSPNLFVEYGGSRVLDYLESNALLDMTPYYEQYPEWKANFNAGVWGKLSYEGYDGVWGVPFKMYTVVLYYNKEIFENNSLTPPESFDDLLAVCEKLNAAGIKPFQAGEKDVWRLGHFSNNLILKSLGVDAVKQLADRSLSYDSPEVVKTFSIISDMIQKGYLGEDILSADYSTERSTFAAEECAMRWDGTWYVSDIFGTDIYDKTGAVAFPYIDEKYKTHAQGSASDMWFISTLNKSDEEIAASVALVRYLTTPEYTAGNNEAAASIFPINFEPTANTPANPLLDQVKDIAFSMTEMRDDIQTYDTQSHMLDTVRAALQGLAMGNTPEQCAQEILDRIKEYSN